MIFFCLKYLLFGIKNKEGKKKKVHVKIMKTIVGLGLYTLYGAVGTLLKIDDKFWFKIVFYGLLLVIFKSDKLYFRRKTKKKT